jgi:hypothetical protein
MRREGFTILEIMIATAILTLGLVGILALFPVAIFYGKQIIEQSTSVVIAESVAEGIREGMRNSLRSVIRGGVTNHYFVFKHDGLKDSIPPRREDERPTKDYYILLPRYPENARYSRRDIAIERAKTFVYPETDGHGVGPSRNNVSNGNGNALRANDDGRDYQRKFSNGEVVNDILVEDVYTLGNSFPAPGDKGDHVFDDQIIEAYRQYSFAFEIQASREDANKAWGGKAYQPANQLYRVKIMVYRGFDKPRGGLPVSEPVFELHFEIAK